MELIPQDQDERTLSIFDEENSYSVVNKLPVSLARQLHNADQSLLEMDEVKLRKKVKPGRDLNRIRLNFWEEYDRSCTLNKVMKISAIAGTSCTTNTLIHSYFTDPLKMAWILTPVTEYRALAEEVLEVTMSKVREMVDKLSFLDKQGNFCPRQAKLVMQLTEMMSNRVMGSITQRTQNVNLNQNQAISQPPLADTSEMSDKEAKKELKRLQEQIKKNKNRTIDTEARHVEKEDRRYSTIKPAMEPDPAGYQQNSLTREEGEDIRRGSDGTF